MRVSTFLKSAQKNTRTGIAVVEVNQDLHSRSGSTLRQSQSIVQTVVRVVGARPDADTGKVNAVIVKNSLKLGGDAIILISKA